MSLDPPLDELDRRSGRDRTESYHRLLLVGDCRRRSIVHRENSSPEIRRVSRPSRRDEDQPIDSDEERDRWTREDLSPSLVRWYSELRPTESKDTFVHRTKQTRNEVSREVVRRTDENLKIFQQLKEIVGSFSALSLFFDREETMLKQQRFDDQREIGTGHGDRSTFELKITFSLREERERENSSHFDGGGNRPKVFGGRAEEPVGQRISKNFSLGGDDRITQRFSSGIFLSGDLRLNPIEDHQEREREKDIHRTCENNDERRRSGWDRDRGKWRSEFFLSRSRSSNWIRTWRMALAKLERHSGRELSLFTSTKKKIYPWREDRCSSTNTNCSSESNLGGNDRSVAPHCSNDTEEERNSWHRARTSEALVLLFLRRAESTWDNVWTRVARPCWIGERRRARR